MSEILRLLQHKGLHYLTIEGLVYKENVSSKFTLSFNLVLEICWNHKKVNSWPPRMVTREGSEPFKDLCTGAHNLILPCVLGQITTLHFSSRATGCGSRNLRMSSSRRWSRAPQRFSPRWSNLSWPGTKLPFYPYLMVAKSPVLIGEMFNYPVCPIISDEGPEKRERESIPWLLLRLLHVCGGDGALLAGESAGPA